MHLIQPTACAPKAPVVLFLPARDEEATVAAVLARAPLQVGGHPVVCLVVDDGSRDGTADRARAAGASVVAGGGRGLGAAVRTGLAEAVARGAVAVAFCDADGEYDPAELEPLVAPILAGRAHYVVGSRFLGQIGTMHPWRRLGNRLLTAGLARLTGVAITDGQSGFRALSRRAAEEAVVAHDYNYAQVLTIDLLYRGFGYAEVPIAYSFRTAGRSFVRLGPYLSHVVPAVLGLVLSRRADQSSTTWSRNPARATAQPVASTEPSAARASAAAHAVAMAWWVLSWANSPWRPKLKRRGWDASHDSTAARLDANPRS